MVIVLSLLGTRDTIPVHMCTELKPYPYILFAGDRILLISVSFLRSLEI